MKLPCLIAAASMTAAQAGEVIVTTRPFRIEKTVHATLLPEKPVLLAADPQEWRDFTILEIVPHGAVVKKGDALVKFDREGIDRKIADDRRQLEIQTLELATRELAVSRLEEETRLELEAAQRLARTAGEDLKYFTETESKARQDQARDLLETASQTLENEKEELARLKKAGAEGASEAALKRQTALVKSAEVRHRLADIATRHTIDTILPRELENLQAADRLARIGLEKAGLDLPRQLQAAKIALESARTGLERSRADLARLEKDARLMTLLAPADGIFYHGSMNDGRWAAGGVELIRSARVPLVRSFATLVPKQALLTLEAVTDESTARVLSKGLKGSATLAGREDLALTATVGSAAAVPGADGRYRIQLTPEWEGHKPGELPAEPEPGAGMVMECNFVVYRSDTAIVLPLDALHPGAEGTWVVDLKLADGKTEARTVKRGRIAGNTVEITAGIDPGQVVVVPDES